MNAPERAKPLTSGELMQMGVKGQRPTRERIVATYADKRNWKQVHDDPDGRCYWAWVGPTIVGYELAQIGMEGE